MRESAVNAMQRFERSGRSCQNQPYPVFKRVVSRCIHSIFPWVLLCTLFCSLLPSSNPALAVNILNRLWDWSTFNNSSGVNGYRIDVDSAEVLNGKPSAIIQSERTEQPGECFALIWQTFDAKEFV